MSEHQVWEDSFRTNRPTLSTAYARRKLLITELFSWHEHNRLYLFRNRSVQPAHRKTSDKTIDDYLCRLYFKATALFCKTFNRRTNPDRKSTRLNSSHQ